MNEELNIPPLPRVQQWLSEPLSHEILAAIDRLRRSEDVQHIAIMPDVHLASEVCNGCVVATRELIYPEAVGGDIGCGMAAVAFDCGADVLADEKAAARALAGLYEVVPLNRHSRRTIGDLSDELRRTELGSDQLNTLKGRDGRIQLGTLGGGNHFVEFQSDEREQLWLMLHTGSRAMGQAIKACHSQVAQPSAGGLCALDSSDPAGQAYLSDAGWAVEYARQSRQAIIDAVQALMQRLFGVRVIAGSTVNVDHNHVRREMHNGQELWIHRKGAMSAGLGEPGLIPGSMGTQSFHVLGRGCEAALGSSSHGAGRAMSREQARRLIRLRDAERAMRGVWFDQRRAVRLIEESPAAYKDIRTVMRAQKDLTRIVRSVTPILCYKGC